MNRKLLIVALLLSCALIAGAGSAGAKPTGGGPAGMVAGASVPASSDTQAGQPDVTQSFQDVPPSNSFFNLHPGYIF